MYRKIIEQEPLFASELKLKLIIGPLTDTNVNTDFVVASVYKDMKMTNGIRRIVCRLDDIPFYSGKYPFDYKTLYIINVSEIFNTPILTQAIDFVAKSHKIIHNSNNVLYVEYKDLESVLNSVYNLYKSYGLTNAIDSMTENFVLFGSRAFAINDKNSDYVFAILEKNLVDVLELLEATDDEITNLDISNYIDSKPLNSMPKILRIKKLAYNFDLLIYKDENDIKTVKDSIEMLKCLDPTILVDKDNRIRIWNDALQLNGFVPVTPNTKKEKL